MCYLIDIRNNMKTLEEWSEKKYSTQLYDSDTDDKDISLLPKILSDLNNQTNLYLIVFDSENNVFGHFEVKSQFIGLSLDNEFNSNMFLFTLNSN